MTTGPSPENHARILLLTQLFQPEPNYLKGIDFAKHLQFKGYRVEVLTGFPNYPGGQLYSGYRQGLWRQEEIEGVPVMRVPLCLDHSRSATRRSFSYLSLALSMCLLAPLRCRRFDLIHVYLGPATLCIPARLLARLWGSRLVLDIQDLWPESVTASGMLKSRMASRILDRYCDWAMRRADQYVVLSQGYRQRLIEHGIAQERIHIVHNWADRRLESWCPPEPPIKANKEIDIVYAGNLGPIQGLDVVLESALILRFTGLRIRFVLIGEGAERKQLEEKVRRLDLPNVEIRPRMPLEELVAVYEQADALLIHLKEDPLSEIGIPSKTQACLAAGRPILVGIHGEAARLIERAGAGLHFTPGDPASLVAAVQRLVGMSAEDRARLGRAGRHFYDQDLSMRIGLERMAAVFRLCLKDERRQSRKGIGNSRSESTF